MFSEIGIVTELKVIFEWKLILSATTLKIISKYFLSMLPLLLRHFFCHASCKMTKQVCASSGVLCIAYLIMSNHGMKMPEAK